MGLLDSLAGGVVGRAVALGQTSVPRAQLRRDSTDPVSPAAVEGGLANTVARDDAFSGHPQHVLFPQDVVREGLLRRFLLHRLEPLDGFDEDVVEDTGPFHRGGFSVWSLATTIVDRVESSGQDDCQLAA